MSLFSWLKEAASKIISGPVLKKDQGHEVWINHHHEEDSSNSFSFFPYMVEVIHVNPNVYLAHRGARVCVGKMPIDGTVVDRMNHLAKIVEMGHESVLEHTNVIVLFKIPKGCLADTGDCFSDFLSCLKYCNVRVSTQSIQEEEMIKERILLLVGGSIRAFMHALRDLEWGRCFLYRELLQEAIYLTCEKCFLGQLIKHYLLAEHRCTYLGEGTVSMVKSKVTQLKNHFESAEGDNEDAVCDYMNDPQEVVSDHADLVYTSPINEIYAKVKDYGFTLKDVYKVATLSFVFHDISRTCSHQLVRHRNGISQESQRYVAHDYNKATDFIDPIKMNLEERYSEPEYKNVLEYIDGLNPFKPYLYLISNKVQKEDARAWLPSNVTTRLMMTFTYEHYGAFLKLRLAKGAQKEIRELAEETANLVMDPSKLEAFISYVTTPIGYQKERMLRTDPLLETEVDDLLSETPTDEPRSLKIETQEDAQRLIDLQEKYSKEEDDQL